MNKQKQTLFILIFTILGWAELTAQPVLEDVIYLKNGSIIRGKLLQNQNDTVKIETFGRNIFVYPTSEISKMLKEEMPVSETKKNKNVVPTIQKGIYNFSTIGLLIGSNDTESPSTFSFHTSVGYQFGHFAGLGVGLGIEELKVQIAPFYLTYISKLTSKENSPFFQFNLGYSVPLDKEKNTSDYSNNILKYKGGINIGFDIGIHSFRTLKRAFVLSAGYRYQIVTETAQNSYNQNTYETYTYEFNRLAVKIGFMFM